jgi:hypothetical protein
VKSESEVNCCVKREPIYSERPHIYRQVSPPSEHEAKPASQANQARKPRHPHHPAPVRTSGRPKDQPETNTQARARPNPNQTRTKREPDENQTRTKRKPSGNQAATKTKRVSIHHVEPSRLQTQTKTSGKTAQHTTIPQRGRRWVSGARPWRDRGGGVWCRAGGGVRASDGRWCFIGR